MNLLKTSSFLLLILLLFGNSCAGQSTDTTISREVKNLTAFAKMYGYVKYFHPSDEAREIDWDRLAVLGVKKVKKAKTEDELKKALEALFLPIAPTITFTKTEPDSNTFLSTYVKPIGEENTTDLKTVAWQHLGIDINHETRYVSGRTNREDEALGSRDSHFFLHQNILEQDLPSATVRLRAMIKTTFKSHKSEGELMLRLDDANNRPLQVVTKTVRPPTSDSWAEYMVQADLDSSVSQIKIGAILKNGGELWIADIQLESKDQKGNWKPVSLQNADFEYQEKGRPVGWEARGTDNYDYRVVPDETVDGNSFYIASTISPDHLFQRYPQVGETAVRPLASSLWCEVPLALYSEEDHTLPRSSQHEFNRLKKELETINLTDATGRDKNVRLADIIIAWNIFQYFYPYFDVIDTDWEDQLTLSLEKALTDDTQQEFNATLSHMLASTRDGHIQLRHPSIPEAGLPFLVDWIENRVVVTHSLHEQIQPGDIVLSVDGEPAIDLVKDQIKQTPGSPQLSLFRSLRKLGAGESGTEATVEIKKREGIKSYTVQRSSRHSNNNIGKNDLPVTAQVEEGIYYVDLTRASMDRINDEIDQISSSPGVIFDMRGYPEPQIIQVLQHLLTQPDTSDQWLQIPRIIYPDQKNIVGYQKNGWHLTPTKPHIQGDVVFITDARAISYAESIMSFVEHYNLGEIVGQPTAGTNGNVNSTVLPGGYRFGWTGMKVLKHDGFQHHLIGIQPTVPVEKTIQGIREGKAEFLEKAIQILQ